LGLFFLIIQFHSYFNIAAAIRPFKMTYQTDNTEAAVPTGNGILIPADADGDGTAALIGNVGFCLDFQEK
jgi:hypothetical protein